MANVDVVFPTSQYIRPNFGSSKAKWSELKFYSFIIFWDNLPELKNWK